MTYQKLKDYRVGEKTVQKNGMYAEIISYRTGNDMTVRFEDGKILEHVQYYPFKTGTLNYDMEQRKVSDYRIGEKIVCHNDLIAVIIAYRRHTDIDVQFEDGLIVEHVSYASFFQASIQHPAHKPVLWPYSHPEKKDVGRKKRTLYGYRELLAVNDDNTVDYIDDDGTTVLHGSYCDFIHTHMFERKSSKKREKRRAVYPSSSSRQTIDLMLRY